MFLCCRVQDKTLWEDEKKESVKKNAKPEEYNCSIKKKRRSDSRLCKDTVWKVKFLA